MRRSIAFFVGSRAITIGSAAAGFFAASVVFGFVAGAAGNRGANVVFAFLVAVAVGIACTAARFFDALVIARFIASTAGNRNARIVFAFLIVAAITIGRAAPRFGDARVIADLFACAASHLFASARRRVALFIRHASAVRRASARFRTRIATGAVHGSFVRWIVFRIARRFQAVIRASLIHARIARTFRIARAIAVRRAASRFIHALVIADFFARSAARYRDARSARRTVFVRRAIAVFRAFGRRRVVNASVARADFAAGAIGVAGAASRFIHALMIADFFACAAARYRYAAAARAFFVRRAIGAGLTFGGRAGHASFAVGGCSRACRFVARGARRLIPHIRAAFQRAGVRRPDIIGSAAVAAACAARTRRAFA